MSEFFINDEELTAVKGKVVLLTGMALLPFHELSSPSVQPADVVLS